MNDPATKIFLLARFLCFVSVFYLALHNIVYLLSRNRENKLLWFFGMLTAPLTRPIRFWLKTDTTEGRVLAATLLAFVLLWLLIAVLERMLATVLR